MAKLHLHLNITQKIFLLLILVTLIPFTITNAYWYFNTRNEVRQSVEQNFSTATLQGVESINNFINTKLLGLLAHSQGAALLSGDTSLIRDDLANFLQQDPDIQSLSYVDSKGLEITKIDRKREYPAELLKNIESKPEYKIPAFKFGKEYIGPVAFNENNREITISTPVVYPENSESLKTFSSAKQGARAPGEVFGVLVGVISLSSLQESIASTRIDNDGYMYVIDSEGNIIIHPNIELIAKKVDFIQNPHLKDIINSQDDTATFTSNTGFDINDTEVLMVGKYIERTRWVLITEEALTATTANISQIQKKALPYFTLPLLAAVLLGLLFSYNLTSPIKKLMFAAIKLGKGEYDYQFSIKTGDEFEQLGNSWRSMAQSLKDDHNSLLAEKTTLSTVLNTTANGFVGLDENLKVLFSNEAANQIINPDNKQINGATFDSLAKLTEEKADLSIQELCSSAPQNKYKLQLTTTSGTETTVNLNITAVPDTIVSPIRYILTIHDISKEQELEDMKIDFVSMAAHELRTPLTSMKGYLSVFIDEYGQNLDSEPKKILDRVNISTQRLSSLIEGILNITRMERTGITLNIKSINICQLINDIIKDFESITKEKKLTLSFIKPDTEPANISVDELRIREVINNLLSNAIKFSEAGKEIIVGLTQNEGMIQIYVQDAGIGIPKESLQRLFTKFYRVPGKLEQTVQGTGLGLYISKSIIEMHKGKIWVESEEGKGTTFTFTLPMDTDAKAQVDEQAKIKV